MRFHCNHQRNGKKENSLVIINYTCIYGDYNFMIATNRLICGM